MSCMRTNKSKPGHGGKAFTFADDEANELHVPLIPGNGLSAFNPDLAAVALPPPASNFVCVTSAVQLRAGAPSYPKSPRSSLSDSEFAEEVPTAEIDKINDIELNKAPASDAQQRDGKACCCCAAVAWCVDRMIDCFVSAAVSWRENLSHPRVQSSIDRHMRFPLD